MKPISVLKRMIRDQISREMKKFNLIFVFVTLSSVLFGQEMNSDLSLVSALSLDRMATEKEIETNPNFEIIPNDLEIINLIGACEFSDLDYTLDTMGLNFEIIEIEGNRYFVDIEGSESNLKTWEIATTTSLGGIEKVSYVLIRYYADNKGDLVDFGRYETKRNKKINERKFTYNKSGGRILSYLAVQIKD